MLTRFEPSGQSLSNVGLNRVERSLIQSSPIQIHTMSLGYSTGLCDCFSDTGSCCMVALCGWTCVPESCNWAKSRSDSCHFCHWCCVPCPIWTRRNTRNLNGIHETQYLADWCLYCWCPCCAICQDARELAAIEKRRVATRVPGSSPGLVQPPSLVPESGPT
jgi:hypothetical protein